MDDEIAAIIVRENMPLESIRILQLFVAGYKTALHKEFDNKFVADPGAMYVDVVTASKVLSQYALNVPTEQRSLQDVLQYFLDRVKDKLQNNEIEICLFLDNLVNYLCDSLQDMAESTETFVSDGLDNSDNVSPDRDMAESTETFVSDGLDNSDNVSPEPKLVLENMSLESIKDLQLFVAGYKTALHKEFDNKFVADPGAIYVDCATASKILEQYSLDVPREQIFVKALLQQAFDEVYTHFNIGIFLFLDVLVDKICSSLQNREEGTAEVASNDLDNTNDVLPYPNPVIVNERHVSPQQIEALKNFYCEITGDYFTRDQDYCILTDVIRAIDFIAKGGRLEFEFEGDVEPVFGFNLLSDPPAAELVALEQFQINDVVQAQEFVEQTIKDNVLAKLLSKSELHQDPAIQQARLTLNFIFNKQSSSSNSDVSKSDTPIEFGKKNNL